MIKRTIAFIDRDTRGIIISLRLYDARALRGTLIVIDVNSLKKPRAASFARLDAQVQTGPFC